MSHPHALQDLYRRPGFLLKRCHQVSAAIFLEECAEFKITSSQYAALKVLHEFPGIDQVAMGRMCGLDRTTAGLVIRLLAQRDLIERSINPSDKRRSHICLTGKGAELLAEIGPAAERAQQRVLAALPRESRPVFLALLESFLIGHGADINPMENVETEPSER